jgi:hypothetical protein
VPQVTWTYPTRISEQLKSTKSPAEADGKYEYEAAMAAKTASVRRAIDVLNMISPH